MQRANWDEVIKKLEKDRTLDPKHFWTKIRPMIFGSQSRSIKVTSTGDRTGVILTKDEDIESKFRDEWVGHFKPPPIDKIDPTSLRNTLEFHRNHPDLATPLPFIDISRLEPGDQLLKPFRPIDIAKIFQTFKNKAPGPDQIKKIHIIKFQKFFL